MTIFRVCHVQAANGGTQTVESSTDASFEALSRLPQRHRMFVTSLSMARETISKDRVKVEVKVKFELDFIWQILAAKGQAAADSPYKYRSWGSSRVKPVYRTSYSSPPRR